jgi:phosphatidylserine/phosphatidylglycerophosphate/cardiolipin synthase-like enzyme
VVDNDCDGEIDEDFVLGELDYQIYFNSETAAPAKGPTAESNEMEAALLALINGAETSIDVALYGFDRARLAEALIAAHNREVTVRVVADYDSYHSSSYGPTFAALEASGIPVVVSPYVSYLQHNKFAVIDGTAVWTGSTNWTDTGLTYNINNAVVITSPHVATAYEMEFAEMYAGQFANSKTDNTPHVFTYTNAVMEIYFSPTDAVRQKVLETVTAASSSLDFAIFFWTDDPLGALVQSKVVTEGLAVSGVWDAVGAANSYSEDDRLCDSGVPLKTELFGGKVHHKFMVVDAGSAAPALIMGSTNWSASGFDGGNDENLLIIHSSEAAAAYAAEARALYDRLPAAAVCARISAEAGLAACNDELDNDFDGRVDGGDGDCAESTLALCTDSLDNDGDGWVDGADLGCYGVRTLHLPAVLRP